MIADTISANQAGLAFDTLAATYDVDFTRSLVGRAQRDAVWLETAKVFRDRPAILELNCGTGEDALFLARLGHSVTALDASQAMIDRAMQRKDVEAPNAAVSFQLLPSEDLGSLPMTRFDAVFSNFSGLNCVRDLGNVAAQLANRTGPGAAMLLCISTRVCLWETAWFLLQGKPRKATRRWAGQSIATLNGIAVTVHYSTIGAFAKAFAPHFMLRNVTGIGISVPPSYMEMWMRRFPRVLAWMRRIDTLLCRVPLVRVLGDHVLLQFERMPERSH